MAQKTASEPLADGSPLPPYRPAPEAADIEDHIASFEGRVLAEDERVPMIGPNAVAAHYCAPSLAAHFAGRRVEVGDDLRALPRGRRRRGPDGAVPVSGRVRGQGGAAASVAAAVRRGGGGEGAGLRAGGAVAGHAAERHGAQGVGGTRRWGCGSTSCSTRRGNCRCRRCTATGCRGVRRHGVCRRRSCRTAGGGLYSRELGLYAYVVEARQPSPGEPLVEMRWYDPGGRVGSAVARRVDGGRAARVRSPSSRRAEGRRTRGAFAAVGRRGVAGVSACRRAADEWPEPSKARADLATRHGLTAILTRVSWDVG